MNSRSLPGRMAILIGGVSLLGIAVASCNKQANPTANGGAAEAPPIAALPLAAAAVAPAPPAPPASALPPPTRRISYAPPPRNQRYRYIDRAYSMGGAFADTPPDYTVDYQGTRPWIWRAGNGAYRIIERLPRGERIYYYDPGQDQPFLVRDPDYSYAYDRGELVGVYGPDGSELDDSMASQRAYEASLYYDRSRELYRAAQYQRRQSAYASEWAARRDQLRAEHQMWEEQQARNADWRAWHDSHQPEESGLWSQERDQRLAYARAIGIPEASSGPLPNPEELARRQAAFFASRAALRQSAPASSAGPSAVNPPSPPQAPPKPAPAVVKAPAAPPSTQQSQVAASQAKLAQAKAAQEAAAQQAAAQAQRKEAAAAQAKAAQAAQSAKSAADARQKEAAAAQAKAAQAAEAQKAAAQSKQREGVARKAAAEAQQKEAAAAQAKAAQAQKAAAEAKQKEAAAAQAQKAAAEAKQKEAAAAQAKAAEAQRAAALAKQKEEAAAHAKAAQEAQAQKAAAEARQHEAAAAQARSEAAHAPKIGPEAHGSKPASATSKPNGPKAKADAKKDEKKDREQQQ